MASSKSKIKAATGKRRSLAPSAPDVKLGYTTAGRDTMAAIDEELAAPNRDRAEAPLLEISEAPAGRETMAAIAQELASEIRPKQDTLRYGDRISNAPGARLPSRAPPPKPGKPAKQGKVPRPGEAPKPSGAPQPDDGPEVTVTTGSELPPSEQARDGVEIFELLTFIVRGNRVGDLTTDAQRRRFIEQNLLHRVPGGAIDAVQRVEVTPWTAQGTMVVRVWCRT